MHNGSSNTRHLLAFSFLLLLLPISAGYTNILHNAYGQISVNVDQVISGIKELDSDLGSQFQLKNPTPMEFDTYSGIVWQTPDSGFTFSVDAIKGDQSQRQAQNAEFMNITSSATESTTISGHRGWVEAYDNYYNVWVDIRWGDENYVSSLAEFTFTIPSSIQGNDDSVKAFLAQKKQDAIDIANKIDAVLTQHGLYNFGGQSGSVQTSTSTSQEITGTITSIRSGADIIITRADGTQVDATVGLVLHKGDSVMDTSNQSAFTSDATIDFGYGKLEVMQSTYLTIGESVLKDNLAKTQIQLKQGSIYQIIDKPIEAKYHVPAMRSDFSTVTPICSASIRGSAMFVSYDKVTNTETVYATDDQAFVRGTSDSQEISVAANQKVTVGSDGTSSSPVSLTSNELATIPGIQALKIPSWIKSNAGWWAKGQISDDEFVKGIQYLISQSIMKIPSTQASSSSSQTIPSWIKSNAGWWADGQISDDEFVKGIQYLVTNGVIILNPGSGTTQSVSLQSHSSLGILQTTLSVSSNTVFKMDKSHYTVNGNPADMATISGKIDSPGGGAIVFTISKPDGTTEQVNADVTNIGNFRTMIIIDSSFPSGTYTVSGNYKGTDLGSTTFNVG